VRAKINLAGKKILNPAKREEVYDARFRVESGVFANPIDQVSARLEKSAVRLECEPA
jgi:hypothetical protein